MSLGVDDAFKLFITERLAEKPDFRPVLKNFLETGDFSDKAFNSLVQEIWECEFTSYKQGFEDCLELFFGKGA